MDVHKIQGSVVYNCEKMYTIKMSYGGLNKLWFSNTTGGIKIED